MAQTMSYEKKYRNIKVKTSDGAMFTGKINITVFQRLSDYLKSSDDKFIAIFTEESEGNVKKQQLLTKNISSGLKHGIKYIVYHSQINMEVYDEKVCYSLTHSCFRCAVSNIVMRASQVGEVE